MADCYIALGRSDEALVMRRDIYERTSKLDGIDDQNTIISATRLADALINEGCYGEARAFCAKQSRVARRVLGSESTETLAFRLHYAISLYNDGGSRLDEALAILEDVHQTTRRLFGDAHPRTRGVQQAISEAREWQADDADGAADAAR